MLIRRFRKLLTTPRTSTSLETRLWVVAGLAIAGVYAYLAMRKGFATQYVVQDDVRQHVFWMQRFLDPSVFPDDLIADYYQAVEPLGFTLLFRIVAMAGIDPILFSKILPIFLGLATTASCFAISMRLFPIPFAAFSASLLLNQVLWQRADISSATPRAFLYPLFLGFLFYLLRRSTIGCVLMIALSGLFYPPITFIEAGVLVLSLVRWEEGGIRLSRDGGDYRLSLTGLAVVVVLLFAFAMRAAEFGPVATADEARMLPPELAGARLSMLRSNAWDRWLWNGQSGLLANMIPLPVALAAGLLLPVVMRYRGRFQLAEKLSPAVRLLPIILLVSAVMFLAAHALLFRLYLPNRYTQHSLFVLMPLAAGPAITILLDSLLQWTEVIKKNAGLAVSVSAIALLGVLLFSYPALVEKFPLTRWITGREPALYEFLLKQPKDTLIASLSTEGNNLPTFTARPVLVAREYANPFHASYYLELHQRYLDLLDAQYTSDTNTVEAFIEKYGVDLFVLDRDAFTPSYPTDKPVLARFKPIVQQIRARLEEGEVPVLLKQMKDCTVLETENLVVLNAECVGAAGLIR